MKPEQIYSIIEGKDLQSEFLENLDLADKELTLHQALEEYYELVILSEVDQDEERILALMEHTGDNWWDCEKHIEKSAYLVLTDAEADEKTEEYLENYLEDIILPELNPTAQQYFDKEEWIEDNNSDRGSCLSYADGHEYCETINKTTYYIYRT